MSELNYADWFETLSEKQRTRVVRILETLRSSCSDPEALVLADAHSEYALIARHLLELDDDEEPFTPSAGRSVRWRQPYPFQGSARSSRAMAVVDRMLAAGITDDEIVDVVEYFEFAARGSLRDAIDRTNASQMEEDVPGHVLAELWDGKMTGRIISGGVKYHPGQYPLDPWPKDDAHLDSSPFRAAAKTAGPGPAAGGSVDTRNGHPDPKPEGGGAEPE